MNECKKHESSNTLKIIKYDLDKMFLTFHVVYNQVLLGITNSTLKFRFYMNYFVIESGVSTFGILSA